MSLISEIPDKSVLESIAAEKGVAIAVVDRTGMELAVFNNNSICRNLNPEGKLIGQCAAFCGTALEEAEEVGSPVSFTCHAGLECRSVAMTLDGKPAAVIAGRTFVKAENYRLATQRAVAGDWSKFPPSEFFENILLTSSPSVLEKVIEHIDDLAVKTDAIPENSETKESTVENDPVSKALTKQVPPQRLTSLVEKFNREMGLAGERTTAKASLEAKPKQEVVKDTVSEEQVTGRQSQAAERSERRTAEARAWRSFFGSLLKTDYHRATNSMLEFLAHQYGFSALIWLDRLGDRFENTATFGEMKNRKVRLGISPDDHRLIEASMNDLPLELGEREKETGSAGSRTMNMFPIGVGDEITAAIAILDNFDDEKVMKQIVRICHSIAPQLEILRLRSKVERGETLASAVRRFSESLKRIDADDFWLSLTQTAAEMLNAERASLLIYDHKAEVFEVRAIVGATNELPADEVIGSRVARIIYEKNEPVVVTDVEKSGLPPTPRDRKYKTSSFFSSPIGIGGRRIGVMSFTDKASGLAFDRTSLELFQAIAPQLAVAIDRGTLKEKAGEFEQLSVTDALTGLLNRRYIEERLLEEVKRSNRHGYPMSFMMLDVDEFKSYNDRFGHPAGDEALKIVAHVIKDTLRGADVAARFGGEEFSILLPQTTAEEAKAIAERIRHNIEYTKFPHRRVTASIGVASCSAELCASADLVHAADKALYGAKGNGRNRVLVFEEMETGSGTN